ncbi:MAG: hypothetical protein N2512_03265 [Armatimonadetes bacterium]|nr:hypothetical protein [Armatimonadota bacterium]
MSSLPEATRGLIVTVGAQAEQVRFTMDRVKPGYVAFLGTETPQCKEQIDALVQYSGIAATRTKVYLVPDEPGAVGQLAAHCLEAVHWLRDTCGVPVEAITIDATGGRKWMSASAIMVATHLGVELAYVDVAFVNGRPDPGSMQLVGLGNVYDRLNPPAWADAVQHYNNYEYRAAAERFAALRSRDLVMDSLAHTLLELANFADRFDRFQACGGEVQLELERIAAGLRQVGDSKAEFRPLFSLAEELERLGANLSSIVVDRPDRGLAALLLLSGDRHLDRGLPEAGVLLYYRVLELAEQVWLREGWEFDVTNPDWGKLPQEVVEAFRERYPGAEQVSLVQGYVLLHLLGHEAVACLGHEHKGQWRPDFEGALEVRNLMVWEHGFRPVTSEAARKLRGWAVKIAEKLCGMTEEEMQQRYGIPAIPETSLWAGAAAGQ